MCYNVLQRIMPGCVDQYSTFKIEHQHEQKHSVAFSIQHYLSTGLHESLQPCSRAARKWRENEEMKRKRRGNGERMRKWRENEEINREWGNGKRMRKSEGEWGNGQRMKKWREISSLSNNFLFLLWNYFTTTLKYVTFCRKNLCIRSTRYGYEPKRLTK